MGGKNNFESTEYKSLHWILYFSFHDIVKSIDLTNDPSQVQFFKKLQ